MYDRGRQGNAHAVRIHWNCRIGSTGALDYKAAQSARRLFSDSDRDSDVGPVGRDARISNGKAVIRDNARSRCAFQADTLYHDVYRPFSRKQGGRVHTLNRGADQHAGFRCRNGHNTVVGICGGQGHEHAERPPEAGVCPLEIGRDESGDALRRQRCRGDLQKGLSRLQTGHTASRFRFSGRNRKTGGGNTEDSGIGRGDLEAVGNRVGVRKPKEERTLAAIGRHGQGGRGDEDQRQFGRDPKINARCSAGGLEQQRLITQCRGTFRRKGERNTAVRVADVCQLQAGVGGRDSCPLQIGAFDGNLHRFSTPQAVQSGTVNGRGNGGAVVAYLE